MGGQGVFVRYDDPAGMDRGMPAQAFQGPGDLDEPAHHRIALHELLQPQFVALMACSEIDVEVVGQSRQSGPRRHSSCRAPGRRP